MAEAWTPSSARSRAGLWLACAALLLLGGFFLGFSGSVDDAHITYWPAWALSQWGEIVNYNFDRVEQSSSLLQVLLLALLQWLLPFISIVTLAHGLTLAAALLTLVFVRRLAMAMLPEPVNTALWLCATAPFFVYWAFGGMEAPLLACALTALPWLTVRYLWRQAGVWWPLTCAAWALLARPEMPLVLVAWSFAGLLLGITTLRRVMQVGRRLLLVSVLQLCLVAVLLVWRHAYFAAWWPQPVLAKVGGHAAGDVLARFMEGLAYGWQVLADPLLLLPAILALLSWLLMAFHCWWRRHPAVMANHLQLLVCLLVALYVGFVLASGGDWMAAGRFWVPVVPLMSVLLAVALHEMFRARSVVAGILLVVVLCHVAYLWRGTSTDFNSVPLWKRLHWVPSDRAQDYSFFERHAREHVHDIPTLAFVQPMVATLLEQSPFAQPGGRRLRIMAGQMGMVMFYLDRAFPRRLQVMDRNGLVEPAFTRCSLLADLPRTRNGLANGYERLLQQADALRVQCGIPLPDVVFDIEAGWNRHNVESLEQAGYVVIYRQRGHIAEEGDWLPLRRIGAGQFIAVSRALYDQLGQPPLVFRDLSRGETAASID